METITIQRLEDYLSEVENLEETDVYRGIGNDRDFKLIPSAGRFGIKDAKTQKEFEQALLRDFKRKAHLYIQTVPANDLEWLFLAQHHGLPTRLLDWTFNPLVALFFALENEHDSDCAVYRSFLSRVITPEQLHGWPNPFDMGEIYQIIPNLSHVRFQNQNGLFTIHPNPGLEDFTLVTKKYLIPREVKPSIRWRLSKIGITKALIFPGLDSVAYDITRMTENKYHIYFNK